MRSLFPNTWHVARREYRMRVRNRTFVIVTCLLAIIGLGIALLPIGIQLVGGDKATTIGLYAADPQLKSGTSTSLATILNAGATSAGQQPARYVIRPVHSPDTARAEVRSGKLDGLLTMTRGDGQELTFDLYTDKGPTNQTVAAVRQAATQISIGDRLQRAGIDPAEAGRIFAPTAFGITPTDPNARNPADNFGAAYVLATVLVILTFLAVVTYGNWVAVSVAEEKSSRVMELLITAATPRQLLAGKVLGNGAAGLSQYAVVVAAALVGLLLQGVLAERLLGSGGGTSLEGVNLWVLAPFGVFFVGGFMLYATLYAGLGSIAARQEDVQQVTGPMIVVGMVGYFAAFVGLNMPDASWIQVLSLVPFFSPYLLPMRMLLSHVAPWEWGLAAVLMVLFLAGALWVAARVYSAGVLLYGQRANLRAVLRAVRVDR
jgi:ABC-2 type transport system permease protein